MGGGMKLQHGILALPLVALIGCGPPDYTPVRDWANVAGNAAIYPELVTRPGAAPTVSPAADAINAMQQALATYLQALEHASFKWKHIRNWRSSCCTRLG